MQLSRICVLWCLDRIFCNYLLSPLDVWYRLILMFLCFCPDDLSIGENGVLKSPTINGQGSICVFNSSSRFLMILGISEFDKYILRIVLSSWLTVPLIILKCPSLSSEQFLIEVCFVRS